MLVAILAFAIAAGSPTSQSSWSAETLTDSMTDAKKTVLVTAKGTTGEQLAITCASDPISRTVAPFAVISVSQFYAVGVQLVTLLIRFDDDPPFPSEKWYVSRRVGQGASAVERYPNRSLP